MAEDEDFHVMYKGARIRVSPVTNKGNIFFIFHFKTPVAVAEGMVNESWVWYEIGNGETTRSAELGEILEKMDI
jgi:hypothetical protein